MEADFVPYGIRRGSSGWKRSTSYHPYELRQGTAEEKVEVSASGTGKRLLEQSNGHGPGQANGQGQANGHKGEMAGESAGSSAAARAPGGQARSPFDRVAR